MELCPLNAPLMHWGLSNITKSVCMEAIWFLGDVNVTKKKTNKTRGVSHLGLAIYL
jgi:hypothetical protein